METPPPVPPKDPPYLRRMAVEHTPHRPSTSGSKRKRSIFEDGTPLDESNLRKGDHVWSDHNGYHSTKRSRSAAPSDLDTPDEATPAMSRSVKRKKKVNNLSNLNLRHAAHEQRDRDLHDNVSPRESKFQEGSLTDKPSDKPPSAFTRITRTDSGDLHNVDSLMADYHDDLLASESTADAIAREKAQISQRVEQITAESAKRDNSGGLFTFGRSLAGSFHPVTLWNKLWHQSKEELTRQKQEEAARKAEQKAQAEAKYAEMKRTGLFGLHPELSVNGSEDEGQPRDSGVIIEEAREIAEEELYTSSGLLPMSRTSASRASERELNDNTVKPGKGFRSRLTLKRPSLANLKNALRPARSEVNLGARAAASSSSISPIKTECDSSTISTVRKSTSKYDLKKTHKLSKRVSDLETRLQQARRDLDNALVDASPMPKMSNKYERFTPSGTFRGHKFLPMRLPRLDSERILLAELAASNAQVNSRPAMELTDEMVDGEPSDEEAVKTLRRRQQENTVTSRAPIDPASEMFEDDQETIKPSRPQSYPPRASTLFSSPERQPNSTLPSTASETTDQPQLSDQTMEDTNTSTSESTPANNGMAQDAKASYSALDAKLKALNEQHKVITKQKKPVKRKSRGGDDAREFKPDGGDDDEAEWKEATSSTPRKRKKRKSSEKNADSPGSKRAKKGSDGKKDKLSLVNVQEEEDVVDQVSSPLSGKGLMSSGKENRLSMSKRISTDSQVLEPLYEEEEEGVAIAVNIGPVKPVLKATPAKQASHIPRSMSPYKSTTVEDEMMSRAGTAAQQHRKAKSGLEVKPSFEWPDDVF